MNEKDLTRETPRDPFGLDMSSEENDASNLPRESKLDVLKPDSKASTRAKATLKKADEVHFETEEIGGWRDNPNMRGTKTNKIISNYDLHVDKSYK